MGILSLSLSPLTGHCLSQLGFLIVQAKQSKHQTLPFLLSSYKTLSLLDLSLSLCSFFLSPLSLVHCSGRVAWPSEPASHLTAMVEAAKAESLPPCFFVLSISP